MGDIRPPAHPAAPGGLPVAVDDVFDAAVFDLDGLLVDSEPLWHEAELRVFNAVGVPITAADVLVTKGRFVGEVADYWYRRRPWTGPTPDEVAAAIVEAVAELFDAGLHLRPGARAALAVCRRHGLRLAVASSSPVRLIDAALRHHGLDRVFEVVHSAEDEGAGKPDPAVFLATAARLGVDPARCVVLEDSPAGVAAAKSAGMACVAVPDVGVAGDPGAPAVGSTGSETDGARSAGPEVHVGFEAADLVVAGLDDLDDDALEALARHWAETSSAAPSPPRRR